MATVAEKKTVELRDSSELLREHSQKDLLRLITCGSVDDGKSTLIGRLLLESGAVYDDQLAALRQESERHGTTGKSLDPALLLDGLEDERQQGITIDVAYRYFTTAKRKFIIADTPGHEQFTRNMATGASTADLAILLVDASKGLLTQTRRHAFITSLMGIKHVILAVNKMDLVEYDQRVFDTIRSQFGEFAAKLDITDVRFVPLSALKGSNVVRASAKMPWHTDGSLLHLLENIYVAADENLQDLRFPVQWVNRPDANFRGFCGHVVSGSIRAGDEVTILPSRKQSQVREICTMDGTLSEAGVSQAVTVTLEDEVDVSRGDMIVRSGNLPHVGRELEAMLVWMSEQPLSPGKQYWLKHTTRRNSAEVSEVRYRVDVDTLHRTPAATLSLNEIGRCHVALHDPVMFDSYRRNRQTGAFVLVDRITHETVAAGMIIDPVVDEASREHWDDRPAAERLVPAVSHVSEERRREQYRQAPVTILLTGLSGSGKTTIALELEERLFERGNATVVLDGQSMRLGICRDLGFTAEERSENLRRAAEVAKLVNESGLICIAAFVAPHEAIRSKVRQLIGPERLVHVHLSTPVGVCRARDATGRYLAADRGDIDDFPGVTSDYEEPTAADLIVSTEHTSSEAIVESIFVLLKKQGLL